MKVPEETSYQERVWIWRREEIWQERHLHIYNAVESKEEGKSREEEMKKFWLSMNSYNFTLMYGQEVDGLADHKISAEEANKAVREAQEVDVEEEEGLSEEEESSEEEDHHMEDIAEDKTIHPKRVPYSTSFATIKTAFKMMDEVDEDLWIGESGASSHLIGSEKGVFDKKMIKGSANTANGGMMKIECEGKVNANRSTKTGY